MRSLLLLFLLSASALAQSTTPAVGKFPAHNLQVSVGTQQRRVGASSYRKTMDIQPKIILEGAAFPKDFK